MDNPSVDTYGVETGEYAGDDLHLFNQTAEGEEGSAGEMLEEESEHVATSGNHE